MTLPFFEYSHDRPVNVSKVKHRSPFRYPGGKTWFVPYYKLWLANLRKKPATHYEPFAGGGIVGLSAVFDGLMQKAVFAEIDEDVAAVWQTMLCDDAPWLAEKIEKFEMSVENVKKEMAKKDDSVRQRAFCTILKNRTAHGGIMADGAGLMKSGEKNKGLASRWYPQTLKRRILDIYAIKHRIGFVHGDGLALLKLAVKDENGVIFVDPPYTYGGKRAGKRLYRHNEVDHEKIFEILKDAKGDFIVTYDISDEIVALAEKYGFAHRMIPMKNTHNAPMKEVVISNASLP